MHLLKTGRKVSKNILNNFPKIPKNSWICSKCEKRANKEIKEKQMSKGSDTFIASIEIDENIIELNRAVFLKLVRP